MLDAKAWGGILLILGSSIGAGMLALPLDFSSVGFVNGSLVLLVCWWIMYSGARCLLAVNMTFPPESHLVSMVSELLGWPGRVLAWGSCLILMYTLLAGYIAGGSDILKSLLGNTLPDVLYTLLFTLGFGAIVYAGIRFVDYVNRGLMFSKLFIYMCVVILVLPVVEVSRLQGGNYHAVPASLMIAITSFGFSSLIPSLRYYFQETPDVLKRVLLIGSLIPLFCYVLWIAVMMGGVSQAKLLHLSHAVQPIGGLAALLGQRMKLLFNVFASLCIVTAFLGVALGMFDFLADGFSMKKRGASGLGLFVLTFLPPMLIVLWDPGIYLNALRYAGRCCIVLLLLLPAFMALKRFGGRPQTYVLCLSALALLYLG